MDRDTALCGTTFLFSKLYVVKIAWSKRKHWKKPTVCVCPSIGSFQCFSLVCGFIVFSQMAWKNAFKGNPITLVFHMCPCRDDSWFCIGSTDGLYVVDLATSELQTVLYFKGRLLVVWFLQLFFFYETWRWR